MKASQQTHYLDLSNAQTLKTTYKFNFQCAIAFLTLAFFNCYILVSILVYIDLTDRKPEILCKNLDAENACSYPWLTGHLVWQCYKIWRSDLAKWAQRTQQVGNDLLLIHQYEKVVVSLGGMILLSLSIWTLLTETCFKHIHGHKYTEKKFFSLELPGKPSKFSQWTGTKNPLLNNSSWNPPGMIDRQAFSRADRKSVV